MNILSERVKIPVAGAIHPMPGYLAYSDDTKKRPAVIVFEEIFGVNSHIRDVTERIARLGYVAIAPDYHHRAAAGQELEYDEAGVKKGMELIPQLYFDGIKTDIEGTLTFLKERSDVDGSRIGCIGFCVGGHVAYLAATMCPFKAAVAFYGGGIATFGPGGGPTTVQRTKGIRGKVLAFFGREDKSIPMEQVDTIKTALAEHRIRNEVVVYDGAGHGFFCDQRGSYNSEAAADAWERVQKFFAEELHPSS